MQILLRFIFQLANTERRCIYNIPPNWTVKYAFLRIRDYIVEDFEIDNAFELVFSAGSVPNNYTNQLEDYRCQYHNYLDSTELVGNYFKNTPIKLYVKRIEDEDYETQNGCIERVAI